MSPSMTQMQFASQEEKTCPAQTQTVSDKTNPSSSSSCSSSSSTSSASSVDSQLRPRHRAKNSTMSDSLAMEEMRDTVNDLDIQLADYNQHANNLATRAYAHSTSTSDAVTEEDVEAAELAEEDQLTPLSSITSSVRLTASECGKVGHERKSSLDLLLRSRMDRNVFENRFLQREEKSESLLNRQTRLSALLARRPSKSKLEAVNILKPGSLASSSILSQNSLALAKAQTKDKLNAFIVTRPEKLAAKKISIPNAD